MPSINLIAARREEKRRLDQNIRRLAFFVAMEFGCVVFLASIFIVRLMTVRSHVAALGEQVHALQPKVNEIQLTEANTAALKPKVATLNEARNTTLYWYTALQTLSACLPDHTSLSGIDTGGDPTPPVTAPANPNGPAPTAVASSGGSATLTFSGTSPTSNEIGLAMLRMNQHPNIASVTLGTVNDSKQNGGDVMQFSMTVLLKPDTAQDVLTPGFGDPSSSTDKSAPAAPVSLTSPIHSASAITPSAKEVHHV